MWQSNHAAGSRHSESVRSPPPQSRNRSSYPRSPPATWRLSADGEGPPPARRTRKAPRWRLLPGWSRRAPIRMKREMPRPIARGETHKRSGGRRQLPTRLEFGHVDTILPQVRIQKERVLGIRLDHVRMGRIMAADGKASRRPRCSLFRSHRPAVLVDKTRLIEPPIRKNRKHRDAAVNVIGHERKIPGCVDTHMRRPGPARIHDIRLAQFPGARLNRKRSH